MEKCVIYNRVSTEFQFENDNLDSQISDCKRLAAYKDLDVAEVFSEQISGEVAGNDRKEFNRMLKFIEDHNIQNIITWEVSRIGRNTEDMLGNVRRFSEKKINIHFKKEGVSMLDDNGDLSANGKLQISILSSMAEYEKDQIKQRMRRGRNHKVITQNHVGLGGKLPYGYKKVNKIREIDEDEAKIVRTIYDMYINGNGSGKIAKWLNKEMIPTRFTTMENQEDTIWQDAVIINILKNPLYKGERKWKIGERRTKDGKKEKIQQIINVKPIVSIETWNKVQEVILSKKYYNTDKQRFENPLKGKLVCGKCGKNYSSRKRTSNRENAYRCSTNLKDKSKCDNVSVNYDKINYITLVVIKKYFADYKKHDFEMELKRSIDSKDLLDYELLELKKAEERLDDAYINIGKMKQEVYKSRQDKILNSIKKVEDKILRMRIYILKIKRLGYESKIDDSYIQKNIDSFLDRIVVEEIPKLSTRNDDKGIKLSFFLLNGTVIPVKLGRYFNFYFLGKEKIDFKEITVK